jgi:hypothetical protein
MDEWSERRNTATLLGQDSLKSSMAQGKNSWLSTVYERILSRAVGAD